MNNTNITHARKNLFQLADNCINFNEVVNINTKKGNVILMSEEEYRGLTETLYLQSLPNFVESLEAAENEEFITIDWKNELGGKK